MIDRRATAAREDGAITLWAFLLMLVLLGFMGLAVDFWHIWEARRDLSGAADAAATAGAGGIDETVFRDLDEVRLNIPLAEAYANESLDAQGDLPVLSERVVDPSSGVDVFVRLETEVDLTLMRIFTATSSVEVDAEATAIPYRSDPCSVAEPCPPPHTLLGGGGP